MYFKRDPLPANSDTIYGFVQFLSRSMQPRSVRNYLSGVKMLHILHGLSYLGSDDILLQLELRGISRMNPHVPARAKPITPAILLAFYNNMDHEDSLHSNVWACGLFLFYTLSRLGSILPTSSSTPKHKFLTRDRVNFCTEGLLVTFLHTKTIQFGKRRLHTPLLKINSLLCPVLAYSQASSWVKAGKYDPAFIFHLKGKSRWLTKSVFIRTFRSVLRAGGVDDSASFTGHSFRRGGATWAFQSGVPGELIQICGNWVSDSYKRYLEFTMDNKLDLAARFIKDLPQLSNDYIR